MTNNETTAMLTAFHDLERENERESVCVREGGGRDFFEILG